MAAKDTGMPASDIKPVGAQAEAESRRMASAPVRDAHSFAEAVKDAAMAGFLAGVLGLFFIGLRTDIAPGGLDVTTRWGAWFTAIVLVFAGRLLLNLFVFRKKHPTTRRLSLASPAREAALAAAGKWLMRVLFVFALILPFFLTTFFPGRDRQYIDLAILIMTYVMLGWGLNIVVGLAGLLDLGYVAFYAIGAYSFALLATYFDFVGFWIALPLAGLLAALWGVILGFPVLRLRGDYLAIVTLAFGEIIRVVLLNWYDFTGGPNGISGIPDPTFFGLEVKRNGSFGEFFGIPYDPIQKFIFLYYIIFVLALITNFATMRLRKLPIGRAWEALREDEIACRSLGINTRNTKLTAFAIGAMFGGFAGSFFATRQGFISPESSTFLESAIILAIVVLGGLGS